MSEQKVPRSGAAAVACLPMVDCESFAVEGGRSSIQIGKIDTPRVATRNGVEYCGVSDKTVAALRAKMSGAEIPHLNDEPRLGRDGVDHKIAEHCGVHHDTVAAQRAKASGGIRQIDTPRVATRNGVEYCGVSDKTVASARAKASTAEIPQSTIRTGADGRTIAEHCGVSDRMVNGVRAGLSGAKVSHLNDEPRLGRDGVDRKIAAHCGVSQPFVAKVRRESSSNGLKMDTPRVATRNGVEYCGVGYTMVADVRKVASARNGQIDTPRVATRNGVEYEIRTAGINANRRPDPREEAAKCVGGTLHI